MRDRKTHEQSTDKNREAGRHMSGGSSIYEWTKSRDLNYNTFVLLKRSYFIRERRKMIDIEYNTITR